MLKRHYFLAVSIPDDVKERLGQFARQLEAPFKTWVYPQDYHITLAFLGSASKEQLQQVSKNVSEIVKRHEKFSLELSNLHSFGSRILWYGVHHEERLFQLQKDVYEACKKVGFSLDERPFTPHITLARKWMGESSIENDLFREKIRETIRFAVTEVVLYETHLDKLPKYKPLIRFSLSD
ncbi:2'-5' RNA ligase [Thermolongibacillus altinsuensis]|uniref:RNA 2',3'-cyclic phosphodiesterase n=1 Tax=Thermolongibacillus altinsuensis TaxID=575256 RepID=A0A4R1QIA0_9BACL|nr:RNA 2',3'-cyclic phosphodiesterase [Thermolongibacillus altinsuensis]TCL51764.1 2'-5' RNA ligase [Thermolongibacillus altinsuensis]GMB09845.1 RNA 2',3'-cyclic phosphodiesterase [Thermolongibacillus altinsuensis]